MKFDINKDLDIILITYNRVDKLKKMLNCIFDNDSPIKYVPITILDNCSDDGTDILIKKYIDKKYKINYIVHNRNIGGNGNIARAMEIAIKKYLWILCDDDNINWKHWDEILYGMENDYDVILTERKIDIKSDKDYHLILNTLAFVSAGIYKTENITNEVMTNAVINIQNGFPHLVIAIHIVNYNKKIYIPKNQILYQNIKFDFQKGLNSEIHYRQACFNLFSNYVNTFQLIKDKKIRYKCCDTLWIGKSFCYSVYNFFEVKPFSMYNLSDFFLGVNIGQKIQIILIMLLKFVLFNIFYFESNYEKIKIKILFVTFVIRRPDQTRPDQTRPDQTRPDQTRPDLIFTYIAIIYIFIIIQNIKKYNLCCNIKLWHRLYFFI
ncbi:glycosyltransferase family 2 protein [Brachyspira innocens]|uniref:glycosyltransferase family 2 protein n=1 Tax=Brachyspira innocens TaxID=13264 RepID=UPI000375C523|nr:glycosyltransferase family 2 protein [Brachyspira innocens]